MVGASAGGSDRIPISLLGPRPRERGDGGQALRAVGVACEYGPGPSVSLLYPAQGAALGGGWVLRQASSPLGPREREMAGRLQEPRWGEPGRRVRGSHGPGCGGPVVGTRVWEGALGLGNLASHRCAGSLSGVKEDPGVWGGLWVPWGRCGAGGFQCQAECGAGGLWAEPRGPQKRGRWVGAWGPRDQGKWASWSFSWPPARPRVPWLPWLLRAAHRRLRWSCQHVLAVGRLRHREQVTMPGSHSLGGADPRTLQPAPHPAAGPIEVGGRKVRSGQGGGRGGASAAWPGRDVAVGPTWGRAGAQDSAESPTWSLSSRPQGCPEAQPGLQAQETSSAAGPFCPQCLPVPHGLQRGPAAVAAPHAPLLAQGRLQG